MSVKYNTALSQYAIFTSSPTSLVALRSNSTFTSIVTTLSTSTVLDGSNVPWQKIHDVEFGDNSNIYVLDRKANSVTLYNGSGFLTDDSLLQNILVYQTSIGGNGTYADDTKFNSPRSISYYNSELYVLDTGNKCIKKYDYNLNWKLTYRLFKDFLSAGPVHIAHNNNGEAYVLNQNWTVYKYNSDFTKKQVFDYTALSAAGDNVHRIEFSQSDSNIFYLLTDYRVFKKLVDAPDSLVGTYLLNKYTFNNDERITAFSTVPVAINGVNYDYNFMLSNSGGAGKITVFQDSINTTSVLTNDSFDVYSLDEIVINSEEYLQNWVINKTISKLLINHMRLRDNITSKFLYNKDTSTDEILLVGTRYLQPTELTAIAFQQNITNYIGVNEIFQNNIINRPFKYIFDIQTNMLSALNADVRKYYKTPQIVYLN